jgi:WD40 repeat protein
MLFRCNILALVGGGKNPRFPTNKVMIWDDQMGKCIGELSFRSDVRGVRLRRDRVVAVLDKKVYVYNFADLKIVDHIETVPNPRGLCALCSHLDHNVLACPGRQRGQVRVDLYHLQKTTVIPAHESELMALALNQDGTMLATASERGTLLRVFSTHTGKLQYEFRRGAERAVIQSIAFNPTSTFLACTSDKGTIHVFKLGALGTPVALSESGGGSQQQQQQHRVIDESPAGGAATAPGGAAAAFLSPFSFVKGILPKYFSSEWSFAQFRVPETHSICAFGSKRNTLLVVCADGSFYRAEFDAETGGECEKRAFARFIKDPEDE